MQKNDKNAKAGKIKNKRGATHNLNESGNVKAVVDADKNITVTATDTSGDMKIERDKWIDMVVALGGSYDPDPGIGLNWSGDEKSINFQTSGIQLPDDCHTLFSGFKGPILGCDKLDTSDVTNMFGMFWWTKEANPDVSNWDTSKVTNMMYMFLWAEKANPDVSNWNTSNVINMARMFRGARLANPDVSDWETSKVTNMVHMFSETKKANPDVSNWDMGEVTNMQGMFRGSGIKKADLSKWELNLDVLNNFENTRSMFDGCSSLEYLKTPTGLKTSTSGVNSDFKIVKLAKGSPATVEKESQNLNAEYTINSGGDKDAEC